MQHLPDDALTLLALGEPATDEETAHLEQCPQCRADFGSFSRVVTAARRAGSPASGAGGNDGGNPAAVPPERHGFTGAAPEPPAPSVWAGIHQALNLDAELRKDPLGAPEDSAPVPSPGSSPASSPASSPVPSLAAARSRRTGTWLAAAAAAVVVAGAGTWGALRAVDSVPGTEVVASADLSPLASSSDTGSAVVDQLPDGRRELVVTSGSDAAQGYREVWLLAPDAQSMVSLGAMTGTEARFVLPADLDLSSYPVVDISDEPFDGDPAHSGNSILRGQLDL